MPALHALLYLRLTIARNLLAGFVLNIRQPRYLLGLAFIAGYFALLLLVRTAAPSRPLPPNAAEGFEFLISLAGTLFLFSAWLVPKQNPGLHFSEAEVAFLFPAPLTRRQLIHYKLCSSMVLGLLSAVILTVMVTLPNRNADVAFFIQRLLAFWSGATLYFFHGMAAALLMYRLADTRFARWWRALVVAVIATVTVVVIGLGLNADFGTLLLMLPGRVLIHTVFANGWEWARWELLLVLLLILHYCWVLKLETPFEERAVVIAAQRAELRARWQEGKLPRISGKSAARRQPFQLHVRMPVELVLMWKSLMRLPAYCNRRVFAGVGFFIVIVILSLQRTTGTEYLAATIGKVGLSFLGYVVLLGPMMPGMDLRRDLSMADQLKAWPLPGWRIVLGSLLAPVLVISAVAWLCLLTAALGFHAINADVDKWLSPALRTTLGMCAAVLIPALVALELVIAYIPFLYFPTWVKPGAGMKRGIDGLGLGMVVMGAMLFMLLLALLPPLVVVALSLYLGQWLASQIAGIVFATIAALLVTLLEVLYAVHLLGERFERLDIAELNQ